MRKLVFVAIALAITAFACSKFRVKAEDEGPIIVKNGSMTVDTADNTGKWEDQGDWSHETTGKNHDGHLWALVIFKDATFCPASSDKPPIPMPTKGDTIEILYSDSQFKPKFKVVGNPPRTKVSPKNDLSLDTSNTKRLRHDDTTGGYITGVQVDNTDLSCNTQITKDNLDQIKICSSEAKCKDATPIATSK